MTGERGSLEIVEEKVFLKLELVLWAVLWLYHTLSWHWITNVLIKPSVMVADLICVVWDLKVFEIQDEIINIVDGLFKWLYTFRIKAFYI